MIKRIISGVVAAVIIVAVIMAGKTAIIIASSIIAAASSYEFCKALNTAGIKPFVSVCIIMGLLIAPMGLLFTHGTIGWVYMIPFAYILLVITSILCLVEFEKRSITDFATTILCLLYIPGNLFFLVSMLSFEKWEMLIWLTIAGTVATDTFAYFIGVFMGKHKILPQISPKKTWEGSIGGLIGGTSVVIILGTLLDKNAGDQFGIIHFICIGVIIGIISQVGDWTASMFKRKLGIKDYGHIIPGHGGFLDRCDSFLFSIPAVYFYVMFIIILQGAIY